MHREEVMRFKTKSTGAHWANFSFEHEVPLGHFAHSSDTCLIWGTRSVWEKYLLGTVLVSGDPLRGCVTVLSSGVCVCVPFV